MLIVLLLSIFGYYLFYNYVIQKSPAFFPVSYISFTAAVVYPAGLLGNIDLGTHIATGFGLFLFLPVLFIFFRETARRSGESGAPAVKRPAKITSWKKLFLNETVFFMLLSCIWIYFLMKGTAPSHCDDFTHWYRVCKIMHAEHSLASSPDLRFQYYTPGTAVWIYYVTKYLPYTVPNCFRAQSVLNASCIAALLSVIPEKADLTVRIRAFLYVCIAGVILCAMDVTTYSLLVDGTLALVPMAAVALILMDQKRDLWQFILVLLLSVLTVLIKNSGFLFAAFIAAAWLLWRKENFAGKPAGGGGTSLSRRAAVYAQAVALILVPYILFKLYQIRAARIYGNHGEGRHEVSLDRYKEIFSSHGIETNLNIIKKTLYQVFLVQKGVPQIRMLWIILILVTCVFLLRRYRQRAQYPEKCLVLYLVCCSVIYLLGLILTYMFSMNTNEIDGTRLASFPRYAGTITMYLSGLIFLYFARLALAMEKKALDLALFGTASGLLLVGTSLFDTGYIWGFEHYTPIEQYSTRVWELCEEYLTENWEYSPEEYTVIWNPDDFSNDLTEVKIRFAIMTYMRADNVNRISLYKFQNHGLSESDIADLKNSDYLILLGDFPDSYDEISEYAAVSDLVPGLNKVD